MRSPAGLLDHRRPIDAAHGGDEILGADNLGGPAEQLPAFVVLVYDDIAGPELVREGRAGTAAARGRNPERRR